MRKAYSLFIFIAIILFSPVQILSQSHDSNWILISLPYAAVPDNLEDDDVSEIIKKLAERIPEELEAQLRRRSKKSIQFLDRAVLIELQKVTQWENSSGLVQEVQQVVSKPFDGILSTKTIRNLINITIKAKVVDKKSTVTETTAEESLSLEYLQDRVKLDSMYNSLADKIINEILPQNALVRYQFHGWDAPRFLNYSTILPGTTFLSSLAWFLIEDGKVNDSFSRYNDPQSDSQSVARNRIETERTLTRRNIAGNISIVSGALLGVALIRDIFLHGEQSNQPKLAEAVKPNLKLVLAPATTPDKFSLTLFLSF